MEAARLLAFQSALSLLAYTALGFWFVRPWLQTKPRATALSFLVFPQTFRFVGVTLLVPGVVEPGLPDAFARQTAVGDTVTTLLAWLALISLRTGWRLAIPTVWLFNLVGLADLLANVSRGIRMQVAPQLGAAWFVPAFIVPAMVVIHVLIFVFLLRSTERTL
ncbi:hypothetical protein L6Q96_10380 [Candidatus Binatia bacterium]|nr:hypothetical protein [Candidatus Binatia bacterium]